MKMHFCAYQLILILGLLFMENAACYADVKNDFKPSWWCRSAHAQTIFGSLTRAHPDIPFQRERMEAPDGDFFDVDWMYGKPQSPLVIVLHGLTNSSNADYVHTLLEKIQEKHWQAVAINARGTTGVNRLPVMDNSGRTGDLDFLVKKILERKMTSTIYVVGYSAGGNKTLKWLGEIGDSIPEVKKAAAVSVPYDLEKTTANLDKGFDKHVYTRLLLKDLKKNAYEKEAQFPGVFDHEKVKKAATFKEYDGEVTAPIHGFKDAHDYWYQSSSERYLDQIKTPTLLIHAKNDPFLSEKDLPLDKIAASPFLTLILTKDGGHVGFVTGSVPFRQGKWLENKIVEFLESKELK